MKIAQFEFLVKCLDDFEKMKKIALDDMKFIGFSRHKAKSDSPIELKDNKLDLFNVTNVVSPDGVTSNTQAFIDTLSDTNIVLHYCFINKKVITNLYPVNYQGFDDVLTLEEIIEQFGDTLQATFLDYRNYKGRYDVEERL